MTTFLTNRIKNIILIVLYAYLMFFGLLSWHINDHLLTVVWFMQVVFYLASVIFLKKYLLILLFIITYPLLFTLGNNPYSYNIIKSGVIEKTITDKDKTILILKFSDNSTATVLYEEKQCLGREYEQKTNCCIIFSLLKNGTIH